MIRFFLLSLPHQIKKRAYVFGNMHTQKVPPNQVDVYPANSGFKYTTSQSVIDAAKNNGFNFAGRSNWRRFMLTYTWDICCILRSVAENEYKEDYYIFLEDDRILMRDYYTLIRTCQRLDADGELRIFQMFYKIFEKYRSHINTVPIDEEINMNPSGHCLAAFLFTKKGAEFLLHEFLNNKNLEKHKSIEFLPYYIKGEGIFSVREHNTFIQHIRTEYFEDKNMEFQDGRLLRKHQGGA